MNENETTVEVVASESTEPISTPAVSESPEESSGAESIESESSANESAESETVYDDTDATVADAKSDILDDLASMVAEKIKESEDVENETEETEDVENETEETEETEMVVDGENSEDAESIALFDGDSAQVMALSESDNAILSNIQTSVGAIEKRLTSFASGSFTSWMRLSMTDLLLLIIIMILLFRWLFDFGKELFS